MLALALAARQGVEGTGRAELLDAARVSLHYWAKMQRPDGSFDEHYKNEHSLGAAAWTSAAAVPAARLLYGSGRQVPQDITRAIGKAMHFMRSEGEPGRLSNHDAIAACALIDAGALFGNRAWADAGRIKMAWLLEGQNSEGWFMEYDGCDFGYLTVTLSYLTRAYQLMPDERLKRAILKGIAFFSTAIMSDGWFGGPMGSRGTTHFYPYPFAYWSHASKETAQVNGIFSNPKARFQLPSSMDDKHFGNLLTDYLLARRLKARSAPLAKGEWLHPNAGIWCLRTPKQEALAAFRNGGALRARGRIRRDSYGYVLHEGGRAYSTMGLSEYEIEGKNVHVNAHFTRVPENTLSGLKRLSMELFSGTVGRHGKASLLFKKYLIGRLITPKASGRGMRRSINISTLEVRDIVPAGAEPIKSWPSRFVPSSRFYIGGSNE